jgi:hypothetical protein
LISGRALSFVGIFIRASMEASISKEVVSIMFLVLMKITK